jgi:hypothetical protein
MNCYKLTVKTTNVFDTKTKGSDDSYVKCDDDTIYVVADNVIDAVSVIDSGHIIAFQRMGVGMAPQGPPDKPMMEYPFRSHPDTNEHPPTHTSKNPENESWHLRRLLNPRRWTPKEALAWQDAMPNVYNAFNALVEASKTVAAKPILMEGAESPKFEASAPSVTEFNDVEIGFCLEKPNEECGDCPSQDECSKIISKEKSKK